MKNIISKGSNLFYKDEGSGTPLIVIHGFCEDSTLWDSLIKLLPAGLRIIRPDLPGFGKSELPNGEISIDIYAEAVYEILKKENITKCLMVGHSMGGYTALAFAEKYPELLKCMVLFHSTAFADDDNKKQDRLRAIEFLTNHRVDIYIDEVYSKLFTPEFYQKSIAFILQLQKHAYQFSAHGIIGGLNAMRNRPDRTSVLKNLTVPILFIIGKKDIPIPYEKSRQQFALPNVSQLLILDEVAHMGMFEAPDECAKAIKEFLSLVETENKK